MSMRSIGLLFLIVGLSAGSASAQYTKVTTPFHTVNDNFFERIGVGFGFNIRGSGMLPGDDSGSGVVGLAPDGSFTRDIEFRQGSFGSTVPTRGGFDPTNQNSLGFAMRGNEGSAFFNFSAMQGNDRTHISQVPMVVVPNGGQGTFSDTAQRPFVTGIIPVVGAYSPTPRAVSPLFERIQRLHAQPRQQARLAQAQGAPRRPLSKGEALGRDLNAPSTATHGDLSVAEIRRRQTEKDDAKQQELQSWIERAKGAEAAGKTVVAKTYYRYAANRADGELKRQLLKKVKDLSQKKP